MATTRWKSSLANVETRIRRSLGIAGPINSEIGDPLGIIPVVLVDDATRPGSVVGAGIRGRRWSWSPAAGIVGTTHRLIATLITDSPSGVIIRRVTISTNAGAGGVFFRIGIAAPGATYPAGATPVTRDVNYVEGMLSATDLAPVLIGTSGAQDAEPTVGIKVVWEMNLPNTNVPIIVPCDFFLPNGAGMWVASAITTGTMGVNIAGEVY